MVPCDLLQAAAPHPVQSAVARPQGYAHPRQRQHGDHGAADRAARTRLSRVRAQPVVDLAEHIFDGVDAVGQIAVEGNALQRVHNGVACHLS